MSLDQTRLAARIEREVAALADETQPIMLPEFVTQDTAASADEAGALVPALFLIFMVLGSS